jgi:thiamine-monophosphate kinase
MGSEFDVIRRFFIRPTPGTLLGPGDDCALLMPEAGMELAVSTDMLISGRHFLHDTNAFRLGQKSAAVNLSDMAAMGARPRWVTLGLALPHEDDDWIKAFSDGFYETLAAYGTDWVGGDTTRGPLAIAVTIFGEVPPLQALRRSNAQAGDDIWVSGTVGDAAMGLRCLAERISLADSDRDFCVARLETPQPRVALGMALRGIAHAAIDLSDGLLGDLNHILEASGMGAALEWEAIPLSPALRRAAHVPEWRRAVLAGGDDYELCFTAPRSARRAVQEAAARSAVAVSRIGTITADATERRLVDALGQAITAEWAGYNHFRSP